MRKHVLCIFRIKGADQLRGNHAADQGLCFHFKDITIPLLTMSSAIFCGSTAQFVADLVGNQEYSFLATGLKDV